MATVNTGMTLTGKQVVDKAKIVARATHVDATAPNKRDRSPRSVRGRSPEFRNSKWAVFKRSNDGSPVHLKSGEIIGISISAPFPMMGAESDLFI